MWFRGENQKPLSYLIHSVAFTSHICLHLRKEKLLENAAARRHLLEESRLLQKLLKNSFEVQLHKIHGIPVS